MRIRWNIPPPHGPHGPCISRISQPCPLPLLPLHRLNRRLRLAYEVVDSRPEEVLSVVASVGQRLHDIATFRFATECCMPSMHVRAP